MDCTLLDHSDFKLGTNHWGLEYVPGGKDFCAKCGRKSFEGWFNSLEWQNRGKAYWKQAFKEAREQQVFYFKAWPNGNTSRWNAGCDPDEPDPTKILRIVRPMWVKDGIDKAIKQTRYRNRQCVTKEHSYGEYQLGINRAIKRMVKKLENATNVRFAAVDCRKDMRRYRDALEKGCCGYMDITITVLGKKFTIGCNFGH